MTPLDGPHRVETVSEAETASVLGFYERVGYTGGIAPGDTVLIVRSEADVVGAVRLSKEAGRLVLRGMFVDAALRGRRIGTALLTAASDVIGPSECWCVPYSHLIEFYSRIGFQETDRKTVPPFLENRRAAYEQAGSRVTVMRRAPAWSAPPEAGTS